MLHKDEYLNATEAYPTFGFEKALEDARDIAREQYTDDPDDPHWDTEEDEDIDEEEESDDDDYGCDYEKHPLDSSYYEDARFM